MVRTVGKIYIIIYVLLGYIVAYADNIHLAVYDTEGNKCKSIGTGQPFMLEVTLEGVDSGQQRPEIKGIEHFYVRNGGLFMSSINGHATVKHKYKVRIDNPGNYKLGPALFNKNGTQLVSNTADIRVTDQPMPAHITKEKTKTNNAAFLRLTAHKDHAVMGENIHCALRFYYTDDVLNVAPISHPEIPGFTLSKDMEPTKGTDTINGKSYKYLELTWQLTPTEPGKKVVPAYCADFTVKPKDRGYMSHFAFLLGSVGDAKRVYSNALTIHVDPLPAHNGPVHAIGSFTHFNARIEPSVAKEGEGIVCTLELEGQGMFEAKDKGLTLQGLPDSFKYYDSKQYSDDKGKNGETKQYFEFIVQGLHQGDWEIPAQSFTFFDVKSRKYKTLQTLPLTVTILPQTMQQKVGTSTDHSSHNSSLAETDEIRPLHRHGSISVDDQKSMPLWLFLILSCLPMIVFGFQLGKDRIKKSGGSATGKKSAFKHARKTILASVNTHNAAQLYPAFIKLFADYYGMMPQQISNDFINQKLIETGLPSTEVSQWHQFFNQSAEYVFASRAIKENEYAAIGQYACHWLDRFEKIL
jgi:hypothetical protein